MSGEWVRVDIRWSGSGPQANPPTPTSAATISSWRKTFGTNESHWRVLVDSERVFMMGSSISNRTIVCVRQDE